MANVKISDLTAGTPPYDPATLIELSVPAAPYNSRSGKIQDVTAAGVTASITAAGTTQGTATALTTQWNQVTTTAAGTGVVLPSSPVVGWNYVVVNAGANPLLIYPPTGGQIDALGTNAGILLGAGASIGLRCFTSTPQFYSE